MRAFDNKNSFMSLNVGSFFHFVKRTYSVKLYWKGERNFEKRPSLFLPLNFLEFECRNKYVNYKVLRKNILVEGDSWSNDY